MRVKCRRIHLTTLLVALLAVYVTTSTVLHSQHERRIAANAAAQASVVGTAERSKRRSRQNLPPTLKVGQSKLTPSATAAVAKNIARNTEEKMTEERRGEIERFFNNRIKPQRNKQMKKGAQPGQRDRGNRRAGPDETRVVQPLPSSVAPNATFSACLLIKDDNDILPEWLAYHYHVIGLRDLTVAVDPLSVEYPTKILERWRSLTDMKIREWTDDDYMPSDFLVYRKPPEKYMQIQSDFNVELSSEDLLEVSNHRYRQRVFLAKCMKDHRDRGNSWVIHIDTDEYVMASKLLRQMKPDHLTIPPMDQPGAVLDLLKQAVVKTPQQVSYPCISMLRVLFGSVESSREEISKGVPEGFDAKHFESFRWRYHALPHNMSFHGNPKVLLDVSAIPDNDFPEDIVFSIHRPVEAYCHRNKALTYTSFRKQPIAVNHYLGSWDRYAGRNDKRRSRAVYDAKATVRRGKDDGNRLWLQGFVRTFGYNRTGELLGEFYLDKNGLMNDTLPENVTAKS